MIQDVSRLLALAKLVSRKENLLKGDDCSPDEDKLLLLENMELTHEVEKALQQLQLPLVEESRLKKHSYYGFVTQDNRYIPNGYLEYLDEIDNKWKIASFQHLFGDTYLIDDQKVQGLENLLVRFRA